MFRVLGFDTRVSNFRFRVSNLWFRVAGFGFQSCGFGLRDSGFGIRGYRRLVALPRGRVGARVLVREKPAGIWAPGFGFRVTVLESGFWVGVFEFQVSGFRFWVSGFHFWGSGLVYGFRVRSLWVRA